jgi:hypothetical protein
LRQIGCGSIFVRVLEDEFVRFVTPARSDAAGHPSVVSRKPDWEPASCEEIMAEGPGTKTAPFIAVVIVDELVRKLVARVH